VLRVDACPARLGREEVGQGSQLFQLRLRWANVSNRAKTKKPKQQHRNFEKLHDLEAYSTSTTRILDALQFRVDKSGFAIILHTADFLDLYCSRF
jgi:hypothetical protein